MSILEKLCLQLPGFGKTFSLGKRNSPLDTSPLMFGRDVEVKSGKVTGSIRYHSTQPNHWPATPTVEIVSDISARKDDECPEFPIAYMPIFSSQTIPVNNLSVGFLLAGLISRAAAYNPSVPIYDRVDKHRTSQL